MKYEEAVNSKKPFRLKGTKDWLYYNGEFNLKITKNKIKFPKVFSKKELSSDNWEVNENKEDISNLRLNYKAYSTFENKSFKFQEIPFYVLGAVSSPIWFPVGLAYSIGILTYLTVKKEEIEYESYILNQQRRFNHPSNHDKGESLLN